jgi:hypothetical protein
MGTGAAIGAGERARHAGYYSSVMPGLVPGIHVLLGRETKDVDGRDVVREDGAARLMPGHDARRAFANLCLRIFAVRNRLSAEIAAVALRGKKISRAKTFRFPMLARLRRINSSIALDLLLRHD